MTEEEIKLQARLSAIEYSISLSLALTYENAKISAEQVRLLHEWILERLRVQPLYHGSDPAISDAVSDEIALNVERILKAAKALAGTGPPR
jgi:hypothetical protein